MDLSKYCVIIPAYNADHTLPLLLSKLKELYKNIHLYVIDDGSDTNVANYIDPLPDMEILSHINNKGKGTALKTGLKKAQQENFDYALCLDADLQHDPARIIDFIQKQQDLDADIILGRRDFNLRNMPVARVISNYTTSLIISARIGRRLYDSQCGFRLVRLDRIDLDSFIYNGFQFESEFLIRQADKGLAIEEVKIPTIYSNEKSSINHASDTLKFIKLLLHSIFWKKHRRHECGR